MNPLVSSMGHQNVLITVLPQRQPVVHFLWISSAKSPRLFKLVLRWWVFWCPLWVTKTATSCRALPLNKISELSTVIEGSTYAPPTTLRKYSVDEPFGDPLSTYSVDDAFWISSFRSPRPWKGHLTPHLFKLVLRLWAFWCPLWVTKTSWSPYYDSDILSRAFSE